MNVRFYLKFQRVAEILAKVTKTHFLARHVQGGPK